MKTNYVVKVGDRWVTEVLVDDKIVIQYGDRPIVIDDDVLDKLDMAIKLPLMIYSLSLYEPWTYEDDLSDESFRLSVDKRPE